MYEMNMERLRETLIRDEGVVYEIYEDPLGFPTFGVGHLITDRDEEWRLPVGTPVSDKRIWETFDQDVDIAISECKFLFGDHAWALFPGVVKEILVNMMFNLGRTKLSKFVKFCSHISHHRWEDAAVEGRDSLWYRQVTKRAERLMSRLEKVCEPPLTLTLET